MIATGRLFVFLPLLVAALIGPVLFVQAMPHTDDAKRDELLVRFSVVDKKTKKVNEDQSKTTKCHPTNQKPDDNRHYNLRVTTVMPSQSPQQLLLCYFVYSRCMAGRSGSVAFDRGASKRMSLSLDGGNTAKSRMVVISPRVKADKGVNYVVTDATVNGEPAFIKRFGRGYSPISSVDLQEARKVHPSVFIRERDTPIPCRFYHPDTDVPDAKFLAVPLVGDDEAFNLPEGVAANKRAAVILAKKDNQLKCYLGHRWADWLQHDKNFQRVLDIHGAPKPDEEGYKASPIVILAGDEFDIAKADVWVPTGLKSKRQFEATVLNSDGTLREEEGEAPVLFQVGPDDQPEDVGQTKVEASENGGVVGGGQGGGEEPGADTP